VSRRARLRGVAWSEPDQRRRGAGTGTPRHSETGDQGVDLVRVAGNGWTRRQELPRTKLAEKRDGRVDRGAAYVPRKPPTYEDPHIVNAFTRVGVGQRR